MIKILKSFSNILFILNVKEVGVESSRIQANSGVDSLCLVGGKAKDSQESCKSSTNSTTPPPTKKSRRGCYDRRLVSTYYTIRFFLAIYIL